MGSWKDDVNFVHVFKWSLGRFKITFWCEFCLFSKAYFEDNPRDLQVLRHDKDLHPTRIQPHLKNVPEYLGKLILQSFYVPTPSAFVMLPSNIFAEYRRLTCRPHFSFYITNKPSRFFFFICVVFSQFLLHLDPPWRNLHGKEDAFTCHYKRTLTVHMAARSVLKRTFLYEFS